MSGLPIGELIIFGFVVLLYLAAGAVGIVQLRTGGEKYRRFLRPLVCLAITLETFILIFRAVAIKAIPLTGLFESMIVLTIVFGVVYLFFSIVVEQVWFNSVMVWIILVMVLMAVIVAVPAAEAHKAAATPWAIAHGVAMIFGGVSMTFAAVSAFLYLLGTARLKRKKVSQVIGRVPNIERLERMNLLGLKGGFLLITFGLVGGMGMAAVKSTVFEMSVVDWLTDSKIILIAAAWMLSGVILVSRRMAALKSKVTAYVTIAAFVLILFAIVGTTVCCGTRDYFRGDDIETVEVKRQMQE